MSKSKLLVGSLCLITLFFLFYVPNSYAEIWELKKTADRQSNYVYIIKITGKISPPVTDKDLNKIAMEILSYKKTLEEVHYCKYKIISEQNNSYILGSFIQLEHYVKLKRK